MQAGGTWLRPYQHCACRLMASGMSIRVHALSDTTAVAHLQVATADVTMTALASPIITLLNGPAGDVKSTASIRLDATASRDPDDPSAVNPLTFTWECISDAYPAACFNSSDQGSQSGGLWTLPASLLSIGRTYTFKVTATKDSRSATASLTVTIRQAAAPTGVLRRVCAGFCEPKHNTDAPLVVLLAVDGDFKGTSVQWNVSQVC